MKSGTSSILEHHVLGQSTSTDFLLLKHFTNGLSGLDPTQNSSNSTDGPNF